MIESAILERALVYLIVEIGGYRRGAVFILEHSFFDCLWPLDAPRPPICPYSVDDRVLKVRPGQLTEPMAG